MNDDMKYDGVEIVGRDDDKVFHFIPFKRPKNERSAERVERGVLINLDHDRFFTRLKETP